MPHFPHFDRSLWVVASCCASLKWRLRSLWRLTAAARRTAVRSALTGASDPTFRRHIIGGSCCRSRCPQIGAGGKEWWAIFTSPLALVAVFDHHGLPPPQEMGWRWTVDLSRSQQSVIETRLDLADGWQSMVAVGLNAIDFRGRGSCCFRWLSNSAKQSPARIV